MAKRPTITNISSGYTSTTALNDNFEALQQAFDNTLSRDGSTPNTMSADLDLNGNDITNVNTLTDVSGNDFISETRGLRDAAAASATAAATSATAAQTAQTGAETAYNSVQPYLDEIEVVGDDLAAGSFVAGTEYDFGLITEATAGTSGSPDGFIVTVYNNLDDIGTVAGNDANITTVAGISAEVTSVAGNEANIATVGAISADITSVAGISANVTSVAGNEANINAVAADAADIGSVATNIANVNSVAGNSTNINSVVANETNINAVAADATDIGTVAGLNTEIGSLATISADITTAAGNTADISTVAGVSANVTTVAGISADVSTVATNNANVTAVAGNATNINTVAGDSTDINTLAPISADITTAAANNANITTVAGINANVTTVAGISSDVTAVAADATDIGTVSTNISNVNAVAGNSTNINAVAGNATNINTVAADATDIGTVATNIANVNAVGTDIANVNTVASNLADVNSFGETYRIGTTDPTTSLDVGDLFFNSTTGVLKVYDGTGWTAGVTAGSGFLALTGGTLTGTLTLDADPTTNLGAATKQYVDTEISGLVDSAPATLDTLNELAAALGDDANFSTTVTNSIATKLPLAGGTMTGTIAFDAAQTFPVESEIDAHLNTSTATSGEYLSWNGTDYDWAAVPVGYTDSDVDTHLNTSGASSGQYLGWNGSDYAWSTVDLSTKLNLSGGTMTGAINFVAGQTFDGRDVSADGAKLDGIEANAKDDQTITAGSGLTGGGTGNVTLSHADTSSQASVDNSGATVIQDVTVDTYGHVTGLGSKTMTLADLGYTGATNANYITNNNQLTNGAGYTTYTSNQATNTNSSVTFSTVTASDFNTTSDAKLKTNVETLTGSLDKVKALRGVSFDWEATSTPDIGVIAQEVEEVLPELVNINDNGIKSVKYSNIVGVLIEAIKEQQGQIDALKEKLGE